MEARLMIHRHAHELFLPHTVQISGCTQGDFKHTNKHTKDVEAIPDCVFDKREQMQL